MAYSDPGYAIGKHKKELDTPCLVIDVDFLNSNLRAMQRHVEAAGKQLRPHAKTHKCTTLARRQIECGAIGICAAKVSEAQVLAKHGIRNILITGPLVTTAKVNSYLECLADDPDCAVVVDSLEGLELLHHHLREQGLQARVLVDLDIGQHRTGVALDSAFDFYQRVCDIPTLRVQGIQAYAGQVQHIHSGQERRRQSLENLQRASEVYCRLRQAGLPCEVFSGGGTGTFDIDIELAELTELQAGSYTLMDAEYFSIEARHGRDQFDSFQPALTLLTTVVSAKYNGFVTVDAGLKSIYQDAALPILADENSRQEYSYAWFGDEYGKLIFSGSQTKEGQMRVGDCIEMIVSHCDPTVNLYDFFFVTEHERVIDIWPVDLRGKSQ
jgi:D-serine deaminase-like pyridoxal phosphate-dependent protein